MGTALSTTGNKHHTPCLIGVAISPPNPKAPRLVMGSSAEENGGVRVSLRGEQCVYSSGAHCISIRMMRMCALECVCVCGRARASVCVRVCEYLRGFVVCRCVTKCMRVCVCMHVRVQMLVCMPVCINVCVCVYARMFFVCVHVCMCVCRQPCVMRVLDVCVCVRFVHVISRLSLSLSLSLSLCACAVVRVCLCVFVYVFE